MPDGRPVECYTMDNGYGMSVKVLTLGGILFEINVPDKRGISENVSANLETVTDYLERSPHFGALVGRFCNRIANARFELGGQIYQLQPNNGTNLLHGGKVAFRHLLWEIKPILDSSSVGLELSRISPESEQGFPGTLQCRVTYKLTDKNVLFIQYHAIADKATPINLTQHCYFNLSAFAKQTICDEIIQIFADHYIPVNTQLIPTGEIATVTGTPLDFRQALPIGLRLNQVGAEPKGYDHCYVLSQEPREMTLCAKVSDPYSGRCLEVATTEPGVQFYSGNFLNGSLRAFGKTYVQHAAFCLEAQHFPDSPNQPTFPTTILQPNQEYHQTTEYRFSLDKS